MTTYVGSPLFYFFFPSLPFGERSPSYLESVLPWGTVPETPTPRCIKPARISDARRHRMSLDPVFLSPVLPIFSFLFVSSHACIAASQSRLTLAISSFSLHKGDCVSTLSFSPSVPSFNFSAHTAPYPSRETSIQLVFVVENRLFLSPESSFCSRFRHPR